MSEQLTLLKPNGDEEGLTLATFAQRAYLDYAVSVVKARALPDVSDGCKPVQRRILYTMNTMGLTAGSKHVKSARVVGDVIGKFHPHGDQAAYDALVRMAQDFSLRYPLIDGQGNFGSRDGDNAAAYRYTEARLTPIARLLLDELDEGTADFAPNYDGSQQEPRLLPARLPFVLLNGASGIAVGMATEIPSHNLAEIVRALQVVLADPKADLDAVMREVPGPDFPGGGQIISGADELKAVYATGRGGLKARASYRFEELARGQWQLVVHELPPGISSRRVQEEIEELVNPKPKAGKKTVGADQQQLRQVVLAVLDSMRDESGKEAAVRLVFEPRTSKIDRDEFARTLLAHTSLEASVPVNLVMIGRDGRPQQKPLVRILQEWIEYRVDTVRRRTQYRLDRVSDRVHVLEGRQIVLLSIDRVIKIIRNSDDPKPALMREFKLTEHQTEDILELRLRQLARLEALKIEKELGDLRKEGAALKKLLDSPAALRKQVGKEFDEDAKKHGDARRTRIEAAERAVAEVKVLDEPVTVIVSEMGFARARSGHGHDASQFTFKPGDGLYDAYQCRTVDNLIALGSNGRVYSIPVAQLPSARGDGAPVTSLIDLQAGTRLVAYAAGPADAPLLVATNGGRGFACRLGDLLSRQRAGKQFISVEEGQEPIRPTVVDPASDNLIACASDRGRLLVFEASEIKAQPAGGRGVILMALDDGEPMVAATTCGAAGIVVRGNAAKSGKALEVALAQAELQKYHSHRARKGLLLAPRMRVVAITRAKSPG
ncbi:MAG TPA: DNA topoisomerase IV subunit A [Burkholderiaceae bacterium]|nr:DNA topoisomerase IV subunit A [Burkholderiaceae bacterium]